MSYSVTFKPTEEAINKIKPWNYEKKKNSYNHEDYEEDCKMEIILYCMSDHDSKDASKVVSDLKFKLRYLESTLYDDYKKSIYEEWLRENGEITFYGWNFRNDEPDMEEKSLYEIYLRSLALKAFVVKTPDYFEEQEKFDTKAYDIKNDIEGFIDGMNEVFAYRIIDMFKEFKLNDEDFDDNDGTVSIGDDDFETLTDGTEYQDNNNNDNEDGEK